MTPSGIVHLEIRRPPQEVVDGLRRTFVASAHESLGRRGLLDPEIRPLLPGKLTVGPAVTALCAPGDNLAMHVALSTARRGDVLVVHSAGASLGAQWGGLASHQAVAIGLVGIVVDGAVRDVAVIRTLDVPVWARRVAAWGTAKSTVAGVNVPITCGGVVVEPGDVVMADDDGVLIIPFDAAAYVLEAALARDTREREIAERIRAGERLLDIMKLDEALAAAAPKIVEQPFARDHEH